MTTTHDPHHPAYRDEADVRGELTRVFDRCLSCRRCVDLCTVFPTLFDLMERFDDQDAGRLTPLEQDRIVDQCSQCGLCAVDCPYVPARSEAAVDMPRTVRRAEAMRRAAGHQSWRRRIADRVLERTVRFGRVGRRVARASPGSGLRRFVGALTGISAARRLPPVPDQRFTNWFRSRSDRGDGNPDVVVFPTCLVGYHEPHVGRDLLDLLARQGTTCSLADVGCCGAPRLESGDIDRFATIADRNVRHLAGLLRKGDAVLLVAEPLCARTLREDAPAHCDPAVAADAALVADRTLDAVEALAGPIPPAPDGPARVVWVPSGHRAGDPEGSIPAWFELFGGSVEQLVEVRGCPGTGAAWGFRAENDVPAEASSAHLATRIEAAADDRTVVVADDGTTRWELAARLGRDVLHPISLLARSRGSQPR